MGRPIGAGPWEPAHGPAHEPAHGPAHGPAHKRFHGLVHMPAHGPGHGPANGPAHGDSNMRYWLSSPAMEIEQIFQTSDSNGIQSRSFIGEVLSAKGVSSLLADFVQWLAYTQKNADLQVL